MEWSFVKCVIDATLKRGFTISVIEHGDRLTKSSSKQEILRYCRKKGHIGDLFEINRGDHSMGFIQFDVYPGVLRSFASCTSDYDIIAICNECRAYEDDIPFWGDGERRSKTDAAKKAN